MNFNEFLMGLMMLFFMVMGIVFTIKMSINYVLKYLKAKLLLVKEKRGNV